MEASGPSGPSSAKRPEKADARQAVRGLLRELNVLEYDEAVLDQLVEIMHREVRSVLGIAEELSRKHDGQKKAKLDVSDVRAAIEMRAQMGPRETIDPDVQKIEASRTNSSELPPVPEGGGLLLPSDRSRRTTTNWRLDLDSFA
ncbi:unnamed protein product [Vitrella brassicaformis CCMP3155]|uniref:Transcription initiation factor TFIID subunit 12 domain-containing protein n=1 Tax=Vitrella brassicaformis (strain CCMP3155) TaxID=1169540 RepID=A0A0G4EZI7_VITBC|nr:unnamed protein product [Vitrella brassicaformis CCMP3155]|mmetsp:Transcript_27181/g.67821  ORF Transcript_27181/g.67821 Transcript_27181/m.67821 type:complete len:144 (-) Transcript_27181:418-849(-)|eukprot:CEM04514.1 unnamed protein product [Vitrella brassicaformis CCMP3155]